MELAKHLLLSLNTTCPFPLMKMDNFIAMPQWLLKKCSVMLITGFLIGNRIMDYFTLKMTPNGINYTGTGNPLYNGYLGYQPSFEGDLIDYNATFGFKSEKNGWNQDISLTFGGNQQLYSVNNTLNQSLGAASPIAFKPGGFRFTNTIGNYDINKALTSNFAIAFGSEVRQETYKIIAGDTASYSGQGANSFPGIRAGKCNYKQPV